MYYVPFSDFEPNRAPARCLSNFCIIIEGCPSPGQSFFRFISLFSFDCANALYSVFKSSFFFYSCKNHIEEKRKIPTGELLFVWRRTISSSGDPTGYEYICKTPFWQVRTFASPHKNDTCISDHSVYVFMRGEHYVHQLR